jgi:hypothetical protein
MRNLIALRKGLALVPPPGASSPPADNSALAATLQAELMNLGFMFDEAAFAAARVAPRQWLVAYHDEVLPHLRKQLGASRPHAPLYRNFPTQVMDLSHLQLFFNAIFHYLSNGTWEPPQQLVDRGVRFEHAEFKPLRLATESDLLAVFTRLASANQSLTEDDKQALAWFADTYGPALPLPATIPFKETLCLLAARDLDVPVQTPTDVLRIAVHLSGGDISLPGVPKVLKDNPDPSQLPNWFSSPQYAQYREQYLTALRRSQREAREKFKFRRFTRHERRRLLALLEKTGADVTEMQRHLGRWLRLGERLHPGEFAARFPRSAEAFRTLRNQHDAKTKVRTFPARVDLAIARDWREGMALLAKRPGELARRLDWLLRTFDPAPVLDTFSQVVPAVSAKVLFELYNHFAARIAQAPRAVMLKGRGSKMKTLAPLPPMDRDLVQNVGNTILRELRRRAAALPPMGKVWVDERLKQVPAPFAMRSVNTAVRTYVRGTHVPFRRDAKVVRAFLHWFDEHGSEDLDLSAGLYDERMRYVSHLSYTHLKDDRLNCCHSGDVRHRKGSSAEYVDLDVAACLAHGVRYAAIQCFNYDGRPMHTVRDCVFGLMEREHPRANEIFVPRTISNCMPLANQGTSVVACVLDLLKNEIIWADIESERALPTLENAASRTLEVMKALVFNTKMSVYDLLTLHARERGMLVASESEADVALRWEDFVTDYAKVAGYMNL